MVASGGVACIASPLGASPECFTHASAEDQPPSEVIADAAPAPAPVPSGMIKVLLKLFISFIETFVIVY